MARPFHCTLIPYQSLGTHPRLTFPGSIAPQPRGCEHRPIRLKKALDEIFRKQPFSALAPSWLWSNRAWKVSLGGVPRLQYLGYSSKGIRSSQFFYVCQCSSSRHKSSMCPRIGKTSPPPSEVRYRKIPASASEAIVEHVRAKLGVY